MAKVVNSAKEPRGEFLNLLGPDPYVSQGQGHCGTMPRGASCGLTPWLLIIPINQHEQELKP